MAKRSPRLIVNSFHSSLPATFDAWLFPSTLGKPPQPHHSHQGAFGGPAEEHNLPFSLPTPIPHLCVSVYVPLFPSTLCGSTQNCVCLYVPFMRFPYFMIYTQSHTQDHQHTPQIAIPPRILQSPLSLLPACREQLNTMQAKKGGGGGGGKGMQSCRSFSPQPTPQSHPPQPHISLCLCVAPFLSKHGDPFSNCNHPPFATTFLWILHHHCIWGRGGMSNRGVS